MCAPRLCRRPGAYEEADREMPHRVRRPSDWNDPDLWGHHLDDQGDRNALMYDHGATCWAALWAPPGRRNPDRFYLGPDKVRSMELCHQPPGRERVRVTVEYVTSEVRVLTVHKSLLATVLEDLYPEEMQP